MSIGISMFYSGIVELANRKYMAVLPLMIGALSGLELSSSFSSKMEVLSMDIVRELSKPSRNGLVLSKLSKKVLVDVSALGRLLPCAFCASIVLLVLLDVPVFFCFLHRRRKTKDHAKQDVHDLDVWLTEGHGLANGVPFE
jgi:hypothetical protein